MSDIKEFTIDSRDYFAKNMEQIKEFLKAHKKIKLVSKRDQTNQASGIAETLRRYGYVEFDDIQTTTFLKNNHREPSLVITMHITADFDKLYQEHLEERKKKQEERKKESDEKKKPKDK